MQPVQAIRTGVVFTISRYRRLKAVFSAFSCHAITYSHAAYIAAKRPFKCVYGDSIRICTCFRNSIRLPSAIKKGPDGSGQHRINRRGLACRTGGSDPQSVRASGGPRAIRLGSRRGARPRSRRSSYQPPPESLQSRARVAGKSLESRRRVAGILRKVASESRQSRSRPLQSRGRFPGRVAEKSLRNAPESLQSRWLKSRWAAHR